MVNPYALGSRATPKNQINLTESQALKKFEKYQSKLSSSLERRSKSPAEKKRSTRISLDSSLEDDNVFNKNSDSDSDDDSLFLKNLKTSSNKFIKRKRDTKSPLAAQQTPKSPRQAQVQAPKPAPRRDVFLENNEVDDDDEDDDDIEISIGDRSPTPTQRRKLSSGGGVSNRDNRAASVASSVSSMSTALPKRSTSRVKFLADGIHEESTTSLIEDLLSKNLVLSVEDLEASTSSPRRKKSSKSKKERKSPSSGRRSESAASVKDYDDDNQQQFSSRASSSNNLEQANIILDIDELERSLNEAKVTSFAGKSSKKSLKESKSTSKKASPKIQDDATESSIATDLEIEKLPKKKSKKDSRASVISEIATEKKSSDKSKKSLKGGASYKDDFDTSVSEDLTQTQSRGQNYSERSSSSKKHEHKKSKNKKKTRKSSLSPRKMTSTEIQVDPKDLLKYSDVLKSVNVYNPSSLVLSSLTFFNDSTTLRDLNQITGYNMINQTFNDLIKMNLNFLRTFLATQRTLYEQQVQSIHPN